MIAVQSFIVAAMIAINHFLMGVPIFFEQQYPKLITSTFALPPTSTNTCQSAASAKKIVRRDETKSTSWTSYQGGRWSIKYPNSFSISPLRLRNLYKLTNPQLDAAILINDAPLDARLEKTTIDSGSSTDKVVSNVDLLCAVLELEEASFVADGFDIIGSELLGIGTNTVASFKAVKRESGTHIIVTTFSLKPFLVDIKLVSSSPAAFDLALPVYDEILRTFYFSR